MEKYKRHSRVIGLVAHVVTPQPNNLTVGNKKSNLDLVIC